MEGKMINRKCPVCGYPYVIEVYDSLTGEFVYYMCKQCNTKFLPRVDEYVPHS